MQYLINLISLICEGNLPSLSLPCQYKHISWPTVNLLAISLMLHLFFESSSSINYLQCLSSKPTRLNGAQCPPWLFSRCLQQTGQGSLLNFPLSVFTTCPFPQPLPLLWFTPLHFTPELRQLPQQPSYLLLTLTPLVILFPVTPGNISKLQSIHPLQSTYLLMMLLQDSHCEGPGDIRPLVTS